jgi:hypothetical protein
MNQLGIFGKSGEFLPPPQDQIDALEPAARERFRAVETAYNEMKSAEAATEAAALEVAHAIEAYDKAEKYRTKNFPAPTFHDLWKASTTHAAQLRGR